MPEPFIDRIRAGRILGAEVGQAFQLLAAPTASGSCPAALMQLTGGPNLVHSNVV